MPEEKILEVLNSYKEDCKVGSDGDYENYECIFSEEFKDVANEVVKKIYNSELTKLKAGNTQLKEKLKEVEEFPKWLLSQHRLMYEHGYGGLLKGWVLTKLNELLTNK